MDISFESFCKLVYRLGHPPTSPKSTKPYQPGRILASWVNHLPKPLPPQSGKQLFRLLFPHNGSRRRYGLKEQKLAQELGVVLGLKGLTQWDSVCWDGRGEVGTGCLGREVEIAMKDRSTPDMAKSCLSLRELDALLDELASSSSFSQLSQTPAKENARPVNVVLGVLYRESRLSPYALSVLTQIILRDLRPLLDPLPTMPIRNPTAMLSIKTTAGPKQLTLRDAMVHWDPRMWELYVGGRGNLDICADMVEGLCEDQRMDGSATPVVGVNVDIPKCRKGRSISDALNVFMGTRFTSPAKVIWAETKYDGYRMQIHVEIMDGQSPKIIIYSKSTRNSTGDRRNTHAIICEALNLSRDPKLPCHPSLAQKIGQSSIPSTPSRKVLKTVILEAEVVPYNEGPREGGRGPGIEEFWRLGQAGVTAGRMSSAYSLKSSRKTRHLCLVFFDVLHLDGQGLLHHRYEQRRQILQEIITVIPGFSHLAERVPIRLDRGNDIAAQQLESAFERCNQRREEGLVLKAAESTYAQMRWQWVKLKKDYIPGLGDCIDLALLGAGWDIDRARELRVDTSVFTSFYLGVLTNPERVRSRRETPNFEILFRVSYGIDRSQLESYNCNIRLGRWKSKPYDKDDPFKRRLLGLSWTYSLQRGMVPPSVLFESPMCAEVMGAGFQKLDGSELFELRWPRLQRIYDSSDRSWTEALDAQSLISTAHSALGYQPQPSSSHPYQSSFPSQDSIGAAWKSASNLDLTDIPDLPSPSPAKKDIRSCQSTPNLFGLAMKKENSPTSPLRHRLERGRGRVGINVTRKLVEMGHRFMTAVEGGPQVDGEGGGDGEANNRARPFESPRKNGGGPTKKMRLVLGSPLVEPPKLHATSSPAGPFPQVLSQTLPTETTEATSTNCSDQVQPSVPPSLISLESKTSLLAPALLAIGGEARGLLEQKKRKELEGRKRHRPLSLRSRIKLAAARRSEAVA